MNQPAQAAQFAAYKFEQMGLQHSLETLSDHIHRVKVAADDTRARIQRSVRRSAAQLPRLDSSEADQRRTVGLMY
jgi:hypothetical protein